MSSGANALLEEAIKDAKVVYARKRPKSAALHLRAKDVIPTGATRSVLGYSPFPTAMARGEAAQLWDLDGNEYADFCGELSAGLFGHTEPRIHAAIRDALAGGLNLAAVGIAEVGLAEALCGRFPSLEKVRFTNSGTEANLMAITTALAFTGRSHLLVFKGGYHGGVLSFPITGKGGGIPVPYPFLFGDYNNLKATREIVGTMGSHVAAIMVEPILGAGGTIPADESFLAGLREYADEIGALLVFDEVMTSRMSAGGMQQRTGIIPDMTTIGKYVAGGMNFGAFGGRNHIMEEFVKGLPHSGTFNNNVLSMAAGNVAMRDVFTADVAERHYQNGEALRGRLNAAAKRAVKLQFIGKGSLVQPHFRPGTISRPYIPTAEEDSLRELFFFDMMDAGIYLARRGTAAMSLPTTPAQMDRYVDAVQNFVETRSSILA